MTLFAVCQLHDALVAQEYTIRGWLSDSRADRDMKAYLRKISTKVSIDSDISNAVGDRFYLSEFHVGTDEVPGFGLAHLLDTPAVSLASEKRWHELELLVRHTWLAPDASMREQTVVVFNISDATDAEPIKQRQLARAQTALRQEPPTLAARKTACFPHLRFGRDVDAQLGRLSRAVLDHVVSKLIILDGLVRDWRRNSSDPLISPPIRRESEPTMNMYGTERVFRTAEYGNATFEPHVSAGAAHRIHLRLLYETKTMEIGYIGKHLRTKKFHT